MKAAPTDGSAVALMTEVGLMFECLTPEFPHAATHTTERDRGRDGAKHGVHRHRLEVVRSQQVDQGRKQDCQRPGGSARRPWERLERPRNRGCASPT